MFLSLNTGAIGQGVLSLSQTIELAQKHGFGGIDPPLEKLVTMDDPARAGERVREAGLQWGCLPFPLNFRHDQSAKEGLPSLSKAAAAARRAGCRRCGTFLLPYHDELDYEQNFAEHVRRLRPACRILADNEIRVGLEFVGPKTLRDGHRYPFIHTMDQTIELAGAIGTGNIGLLLDSFHWYTTRSTAEDIQRKLNNQMIVLVHVNDARTGRSPEQQIDRERALPGETGVIDLDGFFGALVAIGYDGPVTAEPMMPQLGEMAPDDAVATVARTMQRLQIE